MRFGRAIMCKYAVEWVQKKCDRCSRIEYAIRRFDGETYIVGKCGVCFHIEEFLLSEGEE